MRLRYVLKIVRTVHVKFKIIVVDLIILCKCKSTAVLVQVTIESFLNGKNDERKLLQ
jgi:hypothetical protein